MKKYVDSNNPTLRDIFIIVQISSALQNGKELSDEVITDAIKTVTSRVVSKSKG